MDEQERREQYERLFGALDELAHEYIKAHEDDDTTSRFFLVGAITATCSAIYNLDYPAGIVSPSSFFTGRED